MAMSNLDHGTQLGSGSIADRYAWVAMGEDKNSPGNSGGKNQGKEVPLPDDDNGGLSAPLPKR